MSFYPITDHNAQAAIDGTAREIRESRQLAAFYKTLADSPLCGRTVTRALLPQLQALYPGWDVGYYIADYSTKRWRELILRRTRDDGSIERYTLYIATYEAPRLSRESLLEQHAGRIDRARKLESALSDFNDALGQYNNLVVYLSALRNRLLPVMTQGSTHNW